MTPAISRIQKVLMVDNQVSVPMSYQSDNHVVDFVVCSGASSKIGRTTAGDVLVSTCSKSPLIDSLLWRSSKESSAGDKAQLSLLADGMFSLSKNLAVR
ncbi:hypothetical protein KCV05_g76, partial [Aureobasidium melanogenum]